MKTKEAIDQLKFTISRGYKTTSKDKLALNAVIEYLNKTEEKTIQENLLFAKLYALVLRDFTTHYKDVEFANKKLNEEFLHDFDYHVDKLRSVIEMTELENFFKSKGIIDTMLLGRTAKEMIEIHKQNAKLYPKIDPKELQSTMDMWTLDHTRMNLVRQINETLQTYKNV